MTRGVPTCWKSGKPWQQLCGSYSPARTPDTMTARPVQPSPPSDCVLVVDDQPENLRLLRRILEREGFNVVEVADAAGAVAAVGHAAPDVVLMDIRMPAHNGFSLCRELKERPATRLVPVVLMTAQWQRSDRLRAIQAGADDFVTKPINPQELTARLHSLARLKRFTDELEHAEHLIVSLAMTIEARDAYTEGHCQRLATYASAIGRTIGLSSAEVSALERGGYLHDLGKIAIPDAILLKDGLLGRDEFETMKQHPLIGERLCGQLRTLAPVRPIIRHHHERLSGSGYPDGLRGDQIPLLAQIMAIVDVFDALTTVRPYRGPVSTEAAIDELKAEVARGLHREDLVDTLAALVASGGIVPAHRRA